MNSISNQNIILSSNTNEISEKGRFRTALKLGAKCIVTGLAFKAFTFMIEGLATGDFSISTDKPLFHTFRSMLSSCLPEFSCRNETSTDDICKISTDNIFETSTDNVYEKPFNNLYPILLSIFAFNLFLQHKRQTESHAIASSSIVTGLCLSLYRLQQDLKSPLSFPAIAITGIWNACFGLNEWIMNDGSPLTEEQFYQKVGNYFGTSAIDAKIFPQIAFVGGLSYIGLDYLRARLQKNDKPHTKIEIMGVKTISSFLSMLLASSTYNLFQNKDNRISDLFFIASLGVATSAFITETIYKTIFSRSQ